MSGYDIQKFVKENLGYFWKESYGQIYPMLKQMAARGLVEVRVEHNNGRPDRRVYSLTSKGRDELEAWLAEPPALPSPRNELLLKLFFGGLGRDQHLLRHVEEFRTRQEAALRQYSEVEQWLRREQAQHPGLAYWLMTLDYGRCQAQALLEWSESTLHTLPQLTKASQTQNSKKQKRGQKKS